MELRYGTNPHQKRARMKPVEPGCWPLRVVSGAPSYINVLVDPSGLSPGDYYGQIQVSSSASNSPQSVFVALTVLQPGSPLPLVSPDGRRVLTAADDWVGRIWDAGSGIEIATLRGHTGGINSAAFNSDATHVITSGGDGDRSIRIWDVTWATNVAGAANSDHGAPVQLPPAVVKALIVT